MNNIGNYNVNTSRYVDHTKLSSRPTDTQQLSAPTAEADRAVLRETATSNTSIERQKQQVISPSVETINQLQSLSSQRAPDNANGLGRVAIQTYDQYASNQNSDQFSDKVRVNVTA